MLNSGERERERQRETRENRVVLSHLKHNIARVITKLEFLGKKQESYVDYFVGFEQGLALDGPSL
jgi:hypothetical protein